MKKVYTIVTALLLSPLSYAEGTTFKLTYENFDFENSLKKYKGKRFGFILSHRDSNSLYQLAYDKTNTETFKPPLMSDLHVNKYYLKYSLKLDDKQLLSVSYATIDDNIMKETDGGHIYGLGYQYGAVTLTQYLSDYEHFNVYQTDLKYTFTQTFGDLFTSATLLGKYIHLDDKNSNTFSANAKEDYFTPGLKVHAHYNEYHIGAGAFLGKRIFAMMNDGFRVQHHAMEFDETYMVGIGKHFGDLDLTLKYIYQSATEIPIHNEDVKVKNVMMQLGYRF